MQVVAGGRIGIELHADRGVERRDRLAPDELDALRRLNAAYRERFGFPFIVCVSDHTPESVLASARERLGHEPGEEADVALREVGRIAAHRLARLVGDEAP